MPLPLDSFDPMWNLGILELLLFIKYLSMGKPKEARIPYLFIVYGTVEAHNSAPPCIRGPTNMANIISN